MKFAKGQIVLVNLGHKFVRGVVVDCSEKYCKVNHDQFAWEVFDIEAVSPCDYLDEILNSDTL